MAAPLGFKINGPALREIRCARNMSVSEVAVEIGVGQPTWSNWEAGRRNATRENVQRIVEVLMISDVRAILWPDVTVSLDDLPKANVA